VWWLNVAAIAIAIWHYASCCGICIAAVVIWHWQHWRWHQRSAPRHLHYCCCHCLSLAAVSMCQSMFGGGELRRSSTKCSSAKQQNNQPVVGRFDGSIYIALPRSVFFTLHATSSPFLFVFSRFPCNATTPASGCFFSFSWQQNATCCHHQVDCFLFFLTECCHGAVALSCAASSVQSGSTDLYGASSGSRGSQFPEAGGSRYPEGGGIRMLVAAALLQLR